MMKIGILGDPLLENPVVGPSAYAHNLIQSLQRAHHELTLVYRDLPENDTYPYTRKLKYRTGKLPMHYRFIRDKLINHAIRDFDVFHDPSNHLMPLGKSRCKKISTIHDVGVLEHPEYFKSWHFDNFKKTLPKIIKVLDGVITVTHFQKKKILKWFQISPDKVYVVPNGVDTKVFKKFKGPNIFKEKYILFVGWIHVRKGVIPLLNAFNTIKHRIKHKLYLVGATAWGTEPVFSEIEKLGLNNRVKVIGAIKHEELPIYYSNAEMMVLPTLNDSFALPVLEAMACQCPVILSDIPSLKEIYEGKTLMVDPSDVSSLEDAMLKVLSDESFRSELVKRGLAFAETMNWDRVVEQTLVVYKSVCSN